MNDFATDSIWEVGWVCKADVPKYVTTRANNRKIIFVDQNLRSVFKF